MLDVMKTFGLTAEDPLRHYLDLRMKEKTYPSGTQNAEVKEENGKGKSQATEDKNSDTNLGSLTTRKRKLQAVDADLETRRSLWRQQVPHLYDLVVTHRRSPCVRTLHWPMGAAVLDKEVVLQRIVFGTREALVIAAVQLPWKAPLTEECQVGQTSLPQDEWRVVKPSVRVTQYMKHEGLMKYLTCSPQTYLLTATQAEGSGDVLLFCVGDWQDAANAECRPDRHLEAPGLPAGCCWISGGNLLSGSSVGAHLWDVEAGSLVREFPSGDFTTTAVASMSSSPELFATSGSDGHCRVWDMRTGDVVFDWDCHQGPASCVAFGPGDLLASGGADSGIMLRELRHPNRSLCSCSWDGAHFGSVSHLAWSPFSRLLAGAYADGRMWLWDVDKAQSVSEVSAEPPGVVFVHGGHSGCEPTGLAWSNDCPQLMASADSNEIQFWRPAATLFGQGPGSS